MKKSETPNCSKVCCATGVKQALELKERLPDTEIYCFYMDLRMYERYFEDLYLEAQQKWGVNFIRGRLSEACENPDGTILVKVEDTLAGKPLKMSLDLMVLLGWFCTFCRYQKDWRDDEYRIRHGWFCKNTR